MSDLIDDNLGMNKAQIIILELETALKREQAWRQDADILVDALACRYARTMDRVRELERKIAVRDELDQIDLFEEPGSIQ